MDQLLGCSRDTVLRKVEALAEQAREHHIKRLAKTQTSFVMMDELETFVHARMRNDVARLGRKTWTTTKNLKALENHLWLSVAWTNGYHLN